MISPRPQRVVLGFSQTHKVGVSCYPQTRREGLCSPLLKGMAVVCLWRHMPFPSSMSECTARSPQSPTGRSAPADCGGAQFAPRAQHRLNPSDPQWKEGNSPTSQRLSLVFPVNAEVRSSSHRSARPSTGAPDCRAGRRFSEGDRRGGIRWAGWPKGKEEAQANDATRLRGCSRGTPP